MTPDAVVHPHDRYLWLSGLLTAFGLATAVVFTLRSTPYLMVLFLGLGLTCAAAGVAIFAAVLVSDCGPASTASCSARSSGRRRVSRGGLSDRLYLIGKARPR